MYRALNNTRNAVPGIPNVTEDPITEIAALASAFRAALEHADRLRLPVTLQAFPQGACGDGALLLAKFLEQHGHGQFDYMLGRRGDGSHAWLQRGSLVVDITADQFDEVGEPVIVRDGSPWHAALDGEAEHVADFIIYDSHTQATLAGAYSLVCAQLPAPLRPPSRQSVRP